MDNIECRRETERHRRKRGQGTRGKTFRADRSQYGVNIDVT